MIYVLENLLTDIFKNELKYVPDYFLKKKLDLEEVKNINEFIRDCHEETKYFKKAGSHRLDDWEKGWNGDGVYYSNDEYNNTPYYFKKNTHIRLNNKVFRDLKGFAEVDILRAYQILIFKKYLDKFLSNTVIEYGCGTGSNIQHLNKYFPKINFFGTDWASSACEKLKVNKILKKDNIFRVDFFDTNTYKSPREAFIAFTNASLEQTGVRYNLFIDYLINNNNCLGGLHIEPIKEIIDTSHILNKQSYEYASKRNYLDGFVAYFKNKGVKILESKDYGIGSKYINGYQLFIWAK